MKKLLFLVSRGALVTNDEQNLIPGVFAALSELSAAGYEFVLIDNTLNAGALTVDTGLLGRIFGSQGIRFTEQVRLEPAQPNAEAAVAKLGAFLTKTVIATKESVVIGSAFKSSGESSEIDGLNIDMLAEKLDLLAAPVRDQTVDMQTVDNNGDDRSWAQISEKLISRNRTSTVHRKSNETDIVVRLDLDKRNKTSHVETGMGFFDHMLEQLAKHGGFEMDLRCNGDLHIDEHHTVEDCALAIGQAMREALGDKRGIDRYGFLLPMDETEVQASIDLSARPSFHFKGDFSRDMVGELSTEMVPHFFKSLSDTLGASLHIKVEGDNAHHQVEATFKAVGRALGQAIKRQGTELPTTKGML